MSHAWAYFDFLDGPLEGEGEGEEDREGVEEGAETRGAEDGRLEDEGLE